MNVMPTSSCSAFSSIWRRLRSFASRAPNGSSSRSTFGLNDQRARERNTSLLTAGQLPGTTVGERAHLDELERGTDPFASLLLRRLLVLQTERDVVGHGEVREQRVVLEDRVHVALVRRDLRDVVAVQGDLPLAGSLEARDHPERGRLPHTRRARATRRTRRRHLEVDPGHGREANGTRQQHS